MNSLLTHNTDSDNPRLVLVSLPRIRRITSAAERVLSCLHHRELDARVKHEQAILLFLHSP